MVRFTVYDKKYKKYKLVLGIPYRDIAERLAAYENTGLAPEQLQEVVNERSKITDISKCI